MFKKENCSSPVPENLSPGFMGELELFKFEYAKRSGALLEKINSVASAAASDEIKKWADGLASDRMDIFAGLDQCIAFTAALNEKVSAGRLAGQNEQIIADVTSSENDILSRLTSMQRISSASLQRAFSLGLPAQIKSLEKGTGALLAAAINTCTDLTQFMSNGIQDLAIFLKEHYKTVTHPLDENHPE